MGGPGDRLRRHHRRGGRKSADAALDGRLSPRLLYVCIGSAGALFTLSLLLASRTPTTFAVAVLGENVFQSAAFAVEAAIVLGTIGRDNALAATQFGLMIAAPNLPIAYMQAIDGAAYGAGGVAGALVADGMFSLAACAAAVFVLRRVQAEAPAATAAFSVQP